jgi:hypothetical protein
MLGYMRDLEIMCLRDRLKNGRLGGGQDLLTLCIPNYESDSIKCNVLAEPFTVQFLA